MTAPLPDLDALAKELKDGLFMRYMRAAQKMALLEWRDRTVAPGLMARFEAPNWKFYGFSFRTDKYQMRKGKLPDYVFGGSLRDSLRTRQPVSVNGGTEAVTRMKYGGGHLNFLTVMRGDVSVPTVVRQDINVAIRPYIKRQTTRGGLVRITAVGGYNQIRRNRKVTLHNRSPDSYATEFGRFTQDAPWIRRRAGEIFREIFRRMVWRNGKIKNSALDWGRMIYARR